MSSECHVVLAANEGYGRYCAATIRSLCRSAAAPSRLVVHILTSGFQRRTADMILRAAYENGSLAVVHTIDLSRVASLPTLDHISADTYSRLFAADTLLDVDRFIYLDSDLVVCEDIAPLYQTSLDGMPVAGVVHRNSCLAEAFRKRFELAHAPAYINAGVLVIDAAAWRTESASTRITEWMKANERRLAFSDQDAINHFFLNRTKSLPPRWNVEARYFLDAANGVPHDAEMTQAISKPAIIHYTGPIKPWMFQSHVPHRETYLAHLDAVLQSAGMQPVRRSRSWRNRLSTVIAATRFRLGKLRRSVGW